MTEASFANLSLRPELARALSEVFHYENMTQVQAQAIPVCLKGGDVLAKAKTGTGKTLGFLLPALDTVLKGPQMRRGQIAVLVVSPTRELAMQTAAEATQLLTFCPGCTVETVLGGTNMKREQRALEQGPFVLVATPGRLNDHLENSGLDRRLSDLKVRGTVVVVVVADMGKKGGEKREKRGDKKKRVATDTCSPFPQL
jgi:ATP-dependent RNA helicase MSS116